MASFYQVPEPYNYSNQEVVDIRDTSRGRRRNADVTITYNPSAGFHAQNGRITNIQITVQSNNGEVYTINRRPRGGYDSDDWWINVSRRR